MMKQSSVFEVKNAGGGAPIVLLCEHASNYIPEEFRNLGLSREALSSHAAWDPGAYAVSQQLSGILDAPLVSGTVSRLVYDLNRPPDSGEAMREQSEKYKIPGNMGLTNTEKSRRAERFYGPFHDAVEQLLDERRVGSGAEYLVTIHSFSPEYFGKIRPIEYGFLDDKDTRLGDCLMALAPDYLEGKARRNYPYGPEDLVMHSLERHGASRGIPHAMVEIRNDLVRTENQIGQVAKSLGALLLAATRELEVDA